MKKLLLASTALAALSICATPVSAAPISTYPNASTPLTGNEASIGTQGAGTVQITTGSIATLANSPGVRAALPNGSLPLTGKETIAGTQSGATVQIAAQSLANLTSQAHSLDIGSYGALCNGVADDSAAINAAFNAARALIAAAGSSSDTAIRITGPAIGGTCLVKTSINATGLTFPVVTHQNVVNLDLSGLTIECQVTGGVCFDMVGDRYVTIQGLAILSTTTSEPAVGVQIGRPTAASSADGNAFIRPLIKGSFTETPFLDVASEDTNLFQPIFFNNDINGYALILDGINHFTLASSYQTITLPANTANSFNETLIEGSTIVENAAAPAVWISGMQHSQFLTSYVASIAGAEDFILYMLNGGEVFASDTFDVHTETTVTDTFLLAGNATTFQVYDFAYRDSAPEATGAIFKIGGNVTAAVFGGYNEIQIGNMQGGNTTQIFETSTAGNTTYDGLIAVTALSNFTNIPATFAGCIYIDVGTPQCSGVTLDTPAMTAVATLTGVDGNVSYIAENLSSAVSGYAELLHASDGVTWNTCFGGDTTGGFEVRTGCFPGTAGTQQFKVTAAGGVVINGTTAVSCGAGTANLTTLVVTNGIVTHC